MGSQFLLLSADGLELDFWLQNIRYQFFFILVVK